MANFLTNKVGPLPTWGWMAAGLGVVAFVKWRQSQAANAAAAPTTAVGNLNPDYGPGGWPGQGSLGPVTTAPISATAQAAGSTAGSGSTAGGAPVDSSSSPANAPTTQTRINLSHPPTGTLFGPTLSRVPVSATSATNGQTKAILSPTVATIFGPTLSRVPVSAPATEKPTRAV